ncbi:MAG: hypothetical protein ACKVTZ_20510 [Bacteroidia bacterium]
MAKKITTPKSYSDFTLNNLKTMFGISDKLQNLQLETDGIIPSEWLQTTLAMRKKLPQKTEKAKSEFRIVPILMELHSRNEEKFTFFSGYTFDVDETKALKGRCDFLLTKEAHSTDIEAPIIGIFEAKDDNVDAWVAQCGAEMYAARLFNQQNNEPIELIYGAVTNGYEWLFLRLQENLLLIDTERYNLDNLPKLLGALQKIIDFYTP